MDLRKPVGASLTLVLALALVATTARAEKTLWLVRPLYPGQETLVDRTEKALDKLTPADARPDAVIGQKELAASLKGKTGAELPCFSADARCADPIDPFVAGLGFERIVLVQGGQDEAGFKFRVVSYDPKTGKSNPASATAANLEKALLGAVAKVVPVASTLEVKSNPPGATVFVDDVKVGVTPLNTQVLPGERVIRLDLKLHQPVEETIVVPIRGQSNVERSLDKVAARIVISALPPGTEISIDGAVIGKDKVDRGIAPGDHVIRLTAENYKAFEQSISVKPDQQFALDKTLEPIPGSPADKPNAVTNPNRDKQVVVIQKDPQGPVQPPPPPRPSTPEEQVYEARSYFHVTFEMANLLGNAFAGRRFGDGGLGRTTTIDSPGRTLIGASIEYGVFGKYFGVTVFGLSYLTNLDPWTMSVGYGRGSSRETFGGMEGPRQI
ncbi:MAG TPA: PEGA domain-containing protein, partial [Archangium sp.]